VRPQRTLGLVLTGILGACLVVMIATAEPVEHEVETGPGLQARQNPVLAAERLFTALEVPGHTLERLDELPPPDHVLVIATPDRDRLRHQVDDLEGWIAAGGHLIVEASPAPWDDTSGWHSDPLLDRFDLAVRNYHDYPEPAELLLQLHGGAFSVRLDGSRCVEDLLSEATWQSLIGEDHDCPSALQIRLGQGRLTVLGDLGWIENQAIGELDHAAALWHLATDQGRPAGIWFLIRDTPTDLTAWVLERAWALLVSAGVLLLVWLASASQRFGPLVTPPSVDRRDRLAHVEAVGDFLWRHRRQQTLLDATRKALTRARGRGGALDVAQLSQHAGVATETLSQALSAPAPRDPHAFTQLIALLERLRRT